MGMQPTKTPPIKPGWVLAAVIATVLLLGLTVWQVWPPPADLETASQPVRRERKRASQKQVAREQTPAEQPAADNAATSDASETESADADKEKMAQSPAPSTPAESKASVKPDAKPPVAAELSSQAEEPKGQHGEQTEAATSQPKPEAEQEPMSAIVKALREKEKENIAERGQPSPEENEPAETKDFRGVNPDWLADAQQFASQHHGRVLESRSFSDGVLRVSAGFDAAQIEALPWQLGGGWLETDLGVFAFALSYQDNPPAMRQEIPAVAEKLGLESARIEIRQVGDDISLVAAATPRSFGSGAPSETRNEILPLQNKLDRLTYLWNTCRRMDAASASAESKGKLDETHEMILGVLDITLPKSVDNQAAEKHRDEGNAESDPMRLREKERVTKERSRLLASAEDQAKEEIGKLQRRIQQLRTEANATLKQQEDQNALAVKRFEQCCRKITTVVYQAEDFNANARPADAKDKALPVKAKGPSIRIRTKAALPSVLPTQDSNQASASPEDLKPTSGVAVWVLECRSEVVPDKFSPTYTEMAKLNVQVVAGGKLPFPRWFQDDFQWNCSIWEYPEDGEPHRRELTGVAKAASCPITAGTSQIAVRFWFSRKRTSTGEGLRPVAETSWQIVTPVVAGSEIWLKAPLTQEMLSAIQTPKPAKPGGDGKTKNNR
jgi:hypothetical protein